MRRMLLRATLTGLALGVAVSMAAERAYVNYLGAQLAGKTLLDIKSMIERPQLVDRIDKRARPESGLHERGVQLLRERMLAERPATVKTITVKPAPSQEADQGNVVRNPYCLAVSLVTPGLSCLPT